MLVGAFKIFAPLEKIVLPYEKICSRLHGMCKDREIIKLLGGPTKVARDYGFSVQRVSNWGERGIPAFVILDNPKFAAALRKSGYSRVKKAA